MMNTSDEKSRGKTARDTEARTKRRADQAQIVGGLQAILEADEQLLGFTRGLIAEDCGKAMWHLAAASRRTLNCV